ncbi:TPA: TnpV protein [Streptococcus equi subsp. zooepidemicus]|nr:TnpV protein [Streptococcus equi subsp. zooepidemicus]
MKKKEMKEVWKMKETVVLAKKEYILENEIYTPIVKESPFERQGGTYRLEKMEDGAEVLVPNMKMPEKINASKLNRFGKERLKYLKEEKQEEYQIMLMEETLMDHLIDIQEQVEDFMNIEEPRMKEAWKMTTEMQDQDFLKYAGLKKNLDMTLTKMAMEQIVWV